MDFFYARVSTKEQNLGRQLERARELGITKENTNLFIDECTGTNFNRHGFIALKEMLRVRNLEKPLGDTLYVHELDRFGRSYDEIKKNIVDIESYGVKIVFLDIPLIETDDEATNKLLRDQFISVLSYMAQKETEKRKERQEQGYAALRKTDDGKYIGKNGRVVGRPKKEVPNFKNFGKYYKMMEDGTLKAVEVMKILGIKKTRFYQIKKSYEEYIERKNKNGETK